MGTERRVTRMESTVFNRLVEDAVEAAHNVSDGSLAIVGLETECIELAAKLDNKGLGRAIGPIVHTDTEGDSFDLMGQPLEVVVITDDAGKELVLRAIAPIVKGLPKIIFAGYKHLDYDDEDYWDLVEATQEPSLANGYPNSRIHLFQCLKSSAKLGLHGSIVEFGMFRGGTTLFLAKAAIKLGMDAKVFGFDTFEGFPPRQHLFDLYTHADLANVSLSEVVGYFEDEPNVIIVPGNIEETAKNRLAEEDVILAFVDTDNYTSGKAAILSIINRVVVGGSIVLDHYTGEDRFNKTLGERMAAQESLAVDPRYLNLHGTGVFTRIN